MAAQMVQPLEIERGLMDLTWEHSFGGTSFDEWDNDMPHPLNLDGKGYIASEEAIDGTALPNVEDTDHLIQSQRGSGGRPKGRGTTQLGTSVNFGVG